MELVRSSLREGREDAFVPEGPAAAGDSATGEGAASEQEETTPTPEGPQSPATVTWTPEALARLERVPGFVRGMVERMYVDYGREHGITELTPEIMDQARDAVGFEGM